MLRMSTVSQYLGAHQVMASPLGDLLCMHVYNPIHVCVYILYSRLGGRQCNQVVRVPEVTGSRPALTTKLELFLGRP